MNNQKINNRTKIESLYEFCTENAVWLLFCTCNLLQVTADLPQYDLRTKKIS